MLTVKFDYQNPQYDELLTALKCRLLDPGPQLVTDWVRFDKNIHLQFPASDRNWRYWQFEQACFNQSLAISESSCTLLERLLLQNMIPEGYFEGPGIIATFHFASYRILGKWLAVSSVKFVLVVSGGVKDAQQEIFHQQIRECLSDSTAFYVLDANDPKVILKIRSAIREGFMVLIYVDGNIGGDHRVETISLFNSKIRVRTGAIEIAALLGAPLYRIYANRSESALMFNLMPPINSLQGYGRHEVSKGIRGEMLYANIRSAILAAPYLWENWFYLDEFFEH